jgi:hypothetical protein
MCVRMYVGLCMCVYVCVYVGLCMCVYVYVCLYVGLCMCACVCTHVCIMYVHNVCVYVVYINVLYSIGPLFFTAICCGISRVAVSQNSV